MIGADTVLQGIITTDPPHHNNTKQNLQPINVGITMNTNITTVKITGPTSKIIIIIIISHHKMFILKIHPTTKNNPPPRFSQNSRSQGENRDIFMAKTHVVLAIRDRPSSSCMTQKNPNSGLNIEIRVYKPSKNS